MSLNTFLKNLFNYIPNVDYGYKLSETQVQNNIGIDKSDKPVSTSLSENIEYLTVKYNTLINSDVNIRKFTLNAKGRQYNAALIYIDGMVDSDIINNYVLKPLMLKKYNKSRHFKWCPNNKQKPRPKLSHNKNSKLRRLNIQFPTTTKHSQNR